MIWEIEYTKRASKDAKKVSAANLKNKVQKMLEALAEDPYRKPPPFEKLVGDLGGCFSRRINIQHRLVYELIEQKRMIKVHSMFLHYE